MYRFHPLAVLKLESARPHPPIEFSRFLYIRKKSNPDDGGAKTSGISIYLCFIIAVLRNGFHQNAKILDCSASE